MIIIEVFCTHLSQLDGHGKTSIGGVWGVQYTPSGSA
jgi:hypothetical protein